VPVALSAAFTEQRSVVAALARHRPANDPELVKARSKLRGIRAGEIAAELIAGWPPLTDQQVEDVVAILRAGVTEAGTP
jgi:hypothetical protein